MNSPRLSYLKMAIPELVGLLLLASVLILHPGLQRAAPGAIGNTDATANNSGTAISKPQVDRKIFGDAEDAPPGTIQSPVQSPARDQQWLEVDTAAAFFAEADPTPAATDRLALDRTRFPIDSSMLCAAPHPAPHHPLDTSHTDSGDDTPEQDTSTTEQQEIGRVKLVGGPVLLIFRGSDDRIRVLQLEPGREHDSEYLLATATRSPHLSSRPDRAWHEP
ncbi:hypothetical protein [Spirochaeta africana]|uniref:Uncharacterized protein n=1 Tax=Spirochaeta africana (strain ATCC 700263 / DSM 8902 / Z-7692) TaxID=889378 RepID=H9UK54_SPIAZ|nr:hypothetical protein [Spirochaeta africana]AFG37897.1 hypothetical protein Spiaf_1840 [Spirochaeta africana DSM 8902]